MIGRAKRGDAPAMVYESVKGELKVNRPPLRRRSISSVWMARPGIGIGTPSWPLARISAHSSIMDRSCRYASSALNTSFVANWNRP